MPTRSVFRCEVCGRTAEPPTVATLERELIMAPRFGEYVDAEPGHWLLWHGRGLYGPARCACGDHRGDHRGDLKALLREHYGTIGAHPWAIGSRPASAEIDYPRARRVARFANVRHEPEPRRGAPPADA